MVFGSRSALAGALSGAPSGSRVANFDTKNYCVQAKSIGTGSKQTSSLLIPKSSELFGISDLFSNQLANLCIELTLLLSEWNKGEQNKLSFVTIRDRLRRQTKTCKFQLHTEVLDALLSINNRLGCLEKLNVYNNGFTKFQLILDKNEQACSLPSVLWLQINKYLRTLL